MSFAFDQGASSGGGSAITSGVRQVIGYLQINGTNIPVVSAEAEQAATRKAGHFSATLALDALPQGIDEDYFATASPIHAGVAVSTQPGGGDITTLVQGQVDDAVFDLESRLLQVTGRDASAPLHQQKSSEKFVNQMPPNIISTIASRVGLNPAVDPISVMAGKIMQIDFAKMTEDMSLGSILHKMAEFMGAGWYVNGTTINVRVAGGGGGSAYLITYAPPSGGSPASGNFLTLRVTRKIPLSGNVTVNVKGWHTRRKQVIASTKMMAGTGTGVTYNYHVPNIEQDHADQHAKSKLADHTRHEISVSAECVGDGTIDISKPLQLSGTKFDQTYEIDSINHVIGDRGYTMMIEAKSAAAGRSSS